MAVVVQHPSGFSKENRCISCRRQECIWTVGFILLTTTCKTSACADSTVLHVLIRAVLCCVPQESIRGCDVFLVQPTCPPVNDHLMELLVTIDACRRASARSITAVLPYYGYARADRKTQVCFDVPMK